MQLMQRRRDNFTYVCKVKKNTFQDSSRCATNVLCQNPGQGRNLTVTLKSKKIKYYECR